MMSIPPRYESIYLFYALVTPASMMSIFLISGFIMAGDMKAFICLMLWSPQFFTHTIERFYIENKIN
jgi:hypothetical protein